ncbi:PmoA family protein [Microlunatus speluncae]|uniref:DUF6807 domain-containing protein n=1 Tax=Microlunatus speluncae TaxID=2594267 RepID=UPI0013755F60|nr:PmoA family protein [Microlunatus speluncae]
MSGSATSSLIIDGATVADYRPGDDLPEVLSPRPSLHPVRTRSGLVLTGEQPADHRHHLGLSLAVADVDGTDFWGGRTYVRGRGSVPLDNHGRQRRRMITAGPDRIEEELAWTDPAGAELITEQRTISARPLDHDGWVLHWASELRARRALRIASPAVNGRPGAGYGGIFWRFPADGRTEVSSPLGDGADVIHGHRATWLVVRHAGPDGRSGTVVLSEPGSRDPWFVRDSGYVGCGPAPATEAPLRLRIDERLHCRLTCVIIDGWHTDPEFLIRSVVRAGEA